jgi:carboxymethylenebutenolidase
MGSWVTLSDGTPAWHAAPAGGGPGVLVCHPWWGLTDAVRTDADRLADEGFTVLAPALYGDRETVATPAEAQARLETARSEAMEARVEAALAALLADEGRTGAGIGAVGFSMGAAWVLSLARGHPELAAVVVYYGTFPGDETTSRADVLGHFAADDPWEPDEAVRELESGLRSAGRGVELHRYDGVRHWFAEEDRPEFDGPTAALAWLRTVDFLRARLATGD